MSDTQIFFLGLAKFIKSIWPVLIFIIIKIPELRRSEADEEKRLAKFIERDKLKRAYNDEHIARRY